MIFPDSLPLRAARRHDDDAVKVEGGARLDDGLAGGEVGPPG